SLMLMPLMALGPFYFMGFRFRAAMLTVGTTVATFAISANLFGLDMPVVMRAVAFLLLITVACATAARPLERASRRSFLESHLIEELAHHDTLTGLKNRRVFDEQLDRLWERG